MGRGSARETDPDSDERVCEADLPVRAVLPPQHEHPAEGEQEEYIAREQCEPGSARLDELRRTRRDQDHEHDGRQEGGPRGERRVAEHVLEVLLAHERRAHQRPEHDDPRTCRDPERPAPGDVQVIQRVPRASLPEGEGDQRGERDRGHAQREGALVRNRSEVDRQDQRSHQDDGQDAAEVVDRIRRLVDVTRHEEIRHQQGHDGERQRDQEDRAPPESLEQRAGDERPERGDPTADR